VNLGKIGGDDWVESRETTRFIRGNRYIMDTRRLSSANQTVDRAELDSQADTCSAGANTAILEYTGTKVSLQPFTNTYKAIKDIPVAMVATVYDCPKTGHAYLLILKEALYSPCIPTNPQGSIIFLKEITIFTFKPQSIKG
jgi:hypothetical protein